MTDRISPLFRALAAGVLLAAALCAGVASLRAEEAGVRIGLMTFREGPFPEMGRPIAQGFNDYVAQLNTRQDGVAGIGVGVVECEFGYRIDRGEECLDELADKGVSLVMPNSEGVTKELLRRAAELRVPLLAAGHGAAALADGRVSRWAFAPPMSHMGEVSAIVQYLAELEGGFDGLRNKRVGVLYLENEFGTEPLPMLEELARAHGFGLDGWAIPTKFTGDQRLQWRQIAFAEPDWLILWVWGPMVATALERAAEFGYPADRVIGGWWTTAEPHLAETQGAATGYRATTYQLPDDGVAVYERILTSVYDGDRSAAENRGFGTAMYRRGAAAAMFATEALRHSFARAGENGANGTSVRDALASLAVSEARLRDGGWGTSMAQVLLDDCRHAGLGGVAVQRWTGEKWTRASGWFEPLQSVVRSHVERAAEAFAKANDIAVDERRCGR